MSFDKKTQNFIDDEMSIEGKYGSYKDTYSSDILKDSEIKNNSQGIGKSELHKKINIFKSDKDQKYRNIFVSKEKSESILQETKQKKIKKTQILNEYKEISKLPVLFIVLFVLLILTRDHFSLNIFDIGLLQWPFEILVFILTSYYIVKHKNQTPKNSAILCALIGFEAGVLIALIKLFYYREFWNIFYLSLEAIFLSITGIIIGFIFSIIFFENKIYKS